MPPRALASFIVLLSALACGPEEPGPKPVVFIDASVLPTAERSLPTCEAACRKLQELDCPGVPVPEGDCEAACAAAHGSPLEGAEAACIVRARDCEAIARCRREGS